MTNFWTLCPSSGQMEKVIFFYIIHSSYNDKLRLCSFLWWQTSTWSSVASCPGRWSSLLYFVCYWGWIPRKSGKLISKTDPKAVFYTLRLMTPRSLYTRSNITGCYSVVVLTTLSNNTVNMIEQGLIGKITVLFNHVSTYCTVYSLANRPYPPKYSL